MLVHESGGDLLAGTGQCAGESGTGDSHLLRGRFLIEPFQVCKPNSFELIDAKCFLLQLVERSPKRFEPETAESAADAALSLGSSHSSEHMFKIIRRQV